MASITPVNSGRQSYKGFFYNPSQEYSIQAASIGPNCLGRVQNMGPNYFGPAHLVPVRKRPLIHTH